MDGIQRQKQNKPSARQRWRGTGEEGEDGDDEEEERRNGVPEEEKGGGKGVGRKGRQGIRGRRGEATSFIYYDASCSAGLMCGEQTVFYVLILQAVCVGWG